MLLEDFNYFINKSINQYVNKRYNIYDVNQQTTDDLRVLKATAILPVTPPYKIENGERKYSGVYKDLAEVSKIGSAGLFDATYEVTLPLDYLHLLNCICIYKMNKNYKCYDAGNYVQFPAKRLTADAWSIIVNDYYNRPLPQRPYYYIHNVNTSTNLPTNPISVSEDGTEGKGTITSDTTGTDISTYYNYRNSVTDIVSQQEVYTKGTNLPRQIRLSQGGAKTDTSVVEREPGFRYGNATNVRMEIRYGSDNTVFELEKVLVDYIKAPQTIRLTQEQVSLTEDTSQIMEFPDYVCQEIINELVRLVMENTADPRLQTNSIVTQSIANPVQQQATQPTTPQQG